MSDIQELINAIIEFRNQRDWEKFHNHKDVALSLMLEAAEVAEHFQWKSEQEIKEYISTHKAEVGDELADVLNWVLLLSHDLGVDIVQAAKDKIAKNAAKYPIEKAKGKHTKYTNLS